MQRTPQEIEIMIQGLAHDMHFCTEDRIYGHVFDIELAQESLSNFQKWLAGEEIDPAKFPK